MIRISFPAYKILSLTKSQREVVEEEIQCARFCKSVICFLYCSYHYHYQLSFLSPAGRSRGCAELVIWLFPLQGDHCLYERGVEKLPVLSLTLIEKIIWYKTVDVLMIENMYLRIQENLLYDVEMMKTLQRCFRSWIDDGLSKHRPQRIEPDPVILRTYWLWPPSWRMRTQPTTEELFLPSGR